MGVIEMKTLTRKELKKMLERKEDFVLINVLSGESFEAEHIPGSINIPLDAPGFDKKVKASVPDRKKKIVVHCSSFQCMASTAATERILQMGYADVKDFKGGLADWKDAGYAVESSD
jgi:rhodanese-related sulfurtransferase